MSGLFYELLVMSIFEGVIAIVMVSELWALQELFWLTKDILSFWPSLLGSELEFELL